MEPRLGHIFSDSAPGQLPVESGVDLVGNLTQSPSTPRQHSPPHHPLVAVAQTWRPYRTLLWQCRASLLVTIDGCVDSGRREAESSCDGHRFGANNLPALFTREFLTGSFSHGKKVGGWSFDILRVQGRRLWRKRKKDASRVQSRSKTAHVDGITHVPGLSERKRRASKQKRRRTVPNWWIYV